MEDISREAGVPRATIYLEFSGGKEDILMASIERYLNQILCDMRDLAKQSKMGRLETLKQVILFNILSNYDRAKDFKYSAPSLENYSKRTRQEMENFFKARIAFYIELLEQAALGQEIPAHPDYYRFAQIIEYGLISFMPPLSPRLEREVLERDANAFFSMLLSGMAKHRVFPAPV